MISDVVRTVNNAASADLTAMPGRIAFAGQTAAAFESGREGTRKWLRTSLGWCKMELCPPAEVCMEIPMPGRALSKL